MYNLHTDEAVTFVLRWISVLSLGCLIWCQTSKKVQKGVQPVVYWHNILNGRFLCADLAVSSQLISDFTSHAIADPREAVNRMSCAAFYLVQKVDRLTSLSVVADREKSITNALQQVMPQSSIIYWWNHILGDVQVCFKNIFEQQFSVPVSLTS